MYTSRSPAQHHGFQHLSPRVFHPCGFRLGCGSFLLASLLVVTVLLQGVTFFTNHRTLSQHNLDVWSAFGVSPYSNSTFDDASIKHIKPAAGIAGNRNGHHEKLNSSLRIHSSSSAGFNLGATHATADALPGRNESSFAREKLASKPEDKTAGVYDESGLLDHTVIHGSLAGSTQADDDRQVDGSAGVFKQAQTQAHTQVNYTATDLHLDPDSKDTHPQSQAQAHSALSTPTIHSNLDKPNPSGSQPSIVESIVTSSSSAGTAGSAAPSLLRGTPRNSTQVIHYVSKAVDRKLGLGHAHDEESSTSRGNVHGTYEWSGDGGMIGKGHNAGTIDRKKHAKGNGGSSASRRGDGNNSIEITPTQLGRNSSTRQEVWRKSYWNSELSELLRVPEPFYVPFDPTKFKDVIKMPRRPVLWSGGFSTKSGYGEEARNYMLSLLQSGIGIPELLWATQHGDIYHNITDFMEPWEQQQVTFMTSWRANHNFSVYTDKAILPHTVVVCHSLPYFWNGQGKNATWGSEGGPCPGQNPHAYVIGRTMTETEDITPEFVAHCNTMDEIWVPSEFHRQQFSRGGVPAHKLRVVPEGINTTFYDPARYDHMLLPRGELIMGSAHPPSLSRSNITVFLSVFKFEKRKGWDALVEAYLTEFNYSDPVELYLLTRNFNGGGDIKVQVAEFFKALVRSKIANFSGVAQLPPIYLVSEFIKSHDLPRFYKAASVVVQPTKGEGWGRPQAEAMAMAIPVISTNWSGTTAFLDDTVGYPLPIDGIYPTWDDSMPFFANQKWAGPSIERLKKLMRYVMNHKEEREAKGRAARQRMLERFSPGMIARIVAAELQRVHKKLARIPTVVKVLCQDEVCTTDNFYQPLKELNDSFWDDTLGYDARQEHKGAGLMHIVWALNVSTPDLLPASPSITNAIATEYTNSKTSESEHASESKNAGASSIQSGNEPTGPVKSAANHSSQAEKIAADSNNAQAAVTVSTEAEEVASDSTEAEGLATETMKAIKLASKANNSDEKGPESSDS